MAGVCSLLRWLIWLLFPVIILSQCNTLCGEGEYCYNLTCNPCKEGTYQDKALHQLIYCLPWTQKTRESHYVIVQNGTSVSDIVWRCKEGYQERQYTVGGYECIKIVITPSTTPLSVASSTESSTQVPTTLYTATTKEGGNSQNSLIIGLTVPSVLLLIVIVILYFLCRRRQHNTVIHGYNAYFTVFVDKLSIELTIKLISILDPDDTTLKRSTPADPNPPELVNRLVTWAESKKGVSKTALQVALDRVHRPYLFREMVPEWMELQKAGLTRDNNSELGNEVFCEKSKRSDRYQLFHFLYENLDPNTVEHLLRQLPDKTFNATDFFKAHKIAGSVAFSDVIEEFYQRNKEKSFHRILNHFLSSNNRNDILANEEFLRLLKLVDVNGAEEQEVIMTRAFLPHLEMVDEVRSNHADKQEMDDVQDTSLPHSETVSLVSIDHVDSQELNDSNDAMLLQHSDTVDQVCDSSADSPEVIDSESALLSRLPNVDHVSHFRVSRHRNGALEEHHLLSS